MRHRESALPPAAILRLSATAVGLGAAATGSAPDVLTVAAMLAALALFFAAERFDDDRLLPRIAPSTLERSSPHWPWPARIAFVAAIALCGGSAAAVAMSGSAAAQHLPWAAALALFALTAALLATPPARRWSARDFAAAAAIVAVAALTMAWQIEVIPPEVHGDESEVGLDARRLLYDPGRGIFSSAWFGLPILHAGTKALGFLAFGSELWGMRMSSAVLATATALFLFAVVRRLSSTGLACAAAIVLLTQRYFIHLGRTGFHYIDTPFFTVLALWLVVRLWQDGRTSSAIWCGVALGLAMHTYFASRFIPVLVASTLLLSAAAAPRGDRLRHVGQLILIAVVALAVAAPLGAHFANHLDEFFGRVQETSILDRAARAHLAKAYGSDAFGDLFALQLRLVLAMFHFVGDTAVQYGYGAPLVDEVSGILLLAGTGTMLARPRNLLALVAITWTLLPMIAGGALTIDTPFFPRMSGIVPFVAVIVAAGAVRVAGSVAVAVAAPARRGRATWGVVAALLASIAAINADTYFRDYAVHHHHTALREVAAWLRQGGAGAKNYLIDDAHRMSLYHGTVSFLAGSTLREDVRDVDAFLRQGRPDIHRARFILPPDSDYNLARLDERFGPLTVERHHNRHGAVAFVTALPAAAAELHQTAAAAPPSARARAAPWLALLALMAAMASAGALRARRHVAAPSTTAPADHGQTGDAVAAADAASIAGPPCTSAADDPATRTPGAAIRWPAFAMLAVVGIAGWLRFAQLESLPAGFYCDEAGNIYNTASILRTGRDETGTLLPLYVWSFDTSYKNPVFIYASMLPAALFGATPFAARATAAGFGILAVVAAFFFGRAVQGPRVGVVAALLLAVLPWHVHFSRIAFELIAFPALFLIGATGLLRFLDGHRSLPWAAAALGLSLYTYVPAKLFVPAFLGVFVLFYRRELWQRRRESIAALTVLIAITVPVIAFDLANRERSTQYAREMSLLNEVSDPVAVVRQLAANYSHFFSPAFLFVDGDPVTRHSLRDHGQLHTVMAPLLLLGCMAIAASPSRRRLLVLVWLALYPLAGALIRREIPSASRGIIGAPAFCVLAAIGADWIWQQSRRIALPRLRAGVIRGVLAATFVILLGAQTARYWRQYTETYPLYSAKHFVGFQYGHREVVEYFLRHYDEYDKLILTTNLSNQPEIFLRLFAGLLYPPGDGIPPFERPPKIDRGTMHELHLYEPGKRILAAVVPRDLLYLADYEVRETIRAPDGSVAFLIVEVREAKDWAHVWMVAGPYPAADSPPLPYYDPERPPQRGPGGRRWRRYQLRRAPIHLELLYGGDVDDACAWAINFVHSEFDQRVHVYAGFDDMGEVWINGEQIDLDDRPNPFDTWEDTSVGTAELREGRNQIAVKTCDVVGGWTFYFRLAGDDGLRVPGIDWEYGFEEGL